jgi:hypothetical protein
VTIASLTPIDGYQEQTHDAYGWCVTVVGMLLIPTGSLHMYRYGFVPATYMFTTTSQRTKEYGMVKGGYRQVHGMLCMHRVCTLEYDGEEHGMFRLSKVSMFGQEIFRGFHGQMIRQR